MRIHHPRKKLEVSSQTRQLSTDSKPLSKRIPRNQKGSFITFEYSQNDASTSVVEAKKNTKLSSANWSSDTALRSKRESTKPKERSSNKCSPALRSKRKLTNVRESLNHLQMLRQDQSIREKLKILRASISRQEPGLGSQERSGQEVKLKNVLQVLNRRQRISSLD